MNRMTQKHNFLGNENNASCTEMMAEALKWSVTLSTLSMMSSWSSRSSKWWQILRRLLIAFSRTDSISSLNISTKKSCDCLANWAEWVASSHSESTAAFLTSVTHRHHYHNTVTTTTTTSMYWLGSPMTGKLSQAGCQFTQWVNSCISNLSHTDTKLLKYHYYYSNYFYLCCL